MSDEFIIKATVETPEVLFDPKKGILKLAGKSMPENSLGFYGALISQLDAYKQKPQATTYVTIAVDYFNSGSIKQIFKLLCIMEELVEMGKEVYIEWHYKKGDELMLSKGLEFSNFLDISIELKEV